MVKTFCLCHLAIKVRVQLKAIHAAGVGKSELLPAESQAALAKNGTCAKEGTGGRSMISWG